MNHVLTIFDELLAIEYPHFFRKCCPKLSELYILRMLLSQNEHRKWESVLMFSIRTTVKNLQRNMNFVESKFLSQKASQSSLINHYIGVGLRLIESNILLIDAQKVKKMLSEVSHFTKYE